MARRGCIDILLLSVFLFGHCNVPIANALGFTGRNVSLSHFWPTLDISD
jgi:hypothetical protein